MLVSETAWVIGKWFNACSCDGYRKNNGFYYFSAYLINRTNALYFCVIKTLYRKQSQYY